MRIQSILGITTLLAILVGCNTVKKEGTFDSPADRMIYDWETAGECATEEELYDQHVVDVYRSYQPLHQQGRAAVHTMLEETGLLPIYDLKGIRGVQPLTSDVCSWLYQEYNERNDASLSDDGCFITKQQDGPRFGNQYAHPLVFNISEFDSRYVVLLVDEEGLGGAALFSLVYDLEKKRLMNIDTKRLNEGPPMNHITYEDGKLHYYWTTEYYPGIEEEPCRGKRVATFDMTSGELWVWNKD